MRPGAGTSWNVRSFKEGISVHPVCCSKDVSKKFFQQKAHTKESLEFIFCVRSPWQGILIFVILKLHIHPCWFFFFFEDILQINLHAVTIHMIITVLLWSFPFLIVIVHLRHPVPHSLQPTYSTVHPQFYYYYYTGAETCTCVQIDCILCIWMSLFFTVAEMQMQMHDIKTGWMKKKELYTIAEYEEVESGFAAIIIFKF